MVVLAGLTVIGTLKLSASFSVPILVELANSRLGFDVGVLVEAPHGHSIFRESIRLLIVMSFMMVFSGTGKS